MKRIIAINLCMVLAILMPKSLWAQEDYAVVKDGTITFYYDNNKELRDGKIYNVTHELQNGPSWNTDNLTTAVFDSSFSNFTPTTAAWWFSGCSQLKEIHNLSNLNLSAATNMSYMFANCSGLEQLDLSGLSTDNIKDMQWMFYRCSGLKKINFQGFNTENVENMCRMFSQCTALEQLDLSSFNTFNVEDMREMFFNCQNLQTVYVGDDWTTIFVGTGSDMFLGCVKLEGGNGTKCDGFGIIGPIDEGYARIDTDEKPGYFTYKAKNTPAPYVVFADNTLTFYYDENKNSQVGQVYDIAKEYTGDGNFPSWKELDIKKVVFDDSFANYEPTSTARWFYSLSGLTEIENIQNLQTNSSTSMAGMFYGCRSLENIDLSNFHTSNVTSLYCMFYKCSSLENLDLSHFDTYNVTNMTAMCYGCSNLKTVDLSSFETQNVENMEYLFFQCNKLETIYAGDGWSTDKLTMDTGDMMFWECTSLVGGEGTACDGITLVSYLYARIDSYIYPGYFTRKSSVGISNIQVDDKENGYYSLDGKYVTHPTKGIYIRNGRKVLVK